VPYEHQFYSCVLKGIFSLDLDAVGTFWSSNKTGYKNITDDYIPVIKQHGGKRKTIKAEQTSLFDDDSKAPWELPVEMRVKRAQSVLKALLILGGGAKLASHLTDVTPKLIVITVIDGGNHPFMNLMTESNNEAKFSFTALRQVMEDYSDRIKDKVYIGRREGFMDELDPSFRELTTIFPDRIVYNSPNQVINLLAGNLSGHIGG